MQLAAISLQNEDWQEAEDYYKDVLKQSPQYAPAWIGRLCVDLKLPEEEKLTTVTNPNALTNHKFFKTALQFADSEVHQLLSRLLVRALLTGITVAMEKKELLEKAEEKKKIAEENARKKRVQSAFDDACKVMRYARSVDDYHKAITAFSRIDSNFQDITKSVREKIVECERKKEALEIEQKAAVAEAEQKRIATEEANRRRCVQDAFNAACKVMNSAQSTDDYRKAITAFGNIDSTYQDISKQIKSNIVECERFMREIQQRYDTDYKAWQKKTKQLKEQYESQHKKWQIETEKIKVQSESWKSQGLCIHCGGKIGFFGSCKDCKKKENEPLSINTQPSSPNYPPEPRKP